MGRLSRILFLSALAVAAYYALFGGRYSVFEVRSAERQSEILQQRLDSLERVNARLAARVDSLENDPGTLERVAREKWGLVRPGERIYRPYADADSAGNDTGPRPD